MIMAEPTSPHRDRRFRDVARVGELPVGDEVLALREQVRALRRIALGTASLVVLSAAGILAVFLSDPSTGELGRRAKFHLFNSDGTYEKSHFEQLWSGPDNVILPHFFDRCDTAAMPPQIAPVRRSGDFLFLSGILGWAVPCERAEPDMAKQIEKAFRWANYTLSAAGSSWDRVMTVTSYHVNMHNHSSIFARFRELYLPRPPYPAWTAVGVPELFFPRQVLEMTMIARIAPCSGLECN